MKTRTIFICVAILASSVSFAQKKGTFADSLTKALNQIVANMPDSCKKFYGTKRGAVKSSYNSTIKLPRSTDNRFDIGVMDYPIIFMSYTAAGNDKVKGAERTNEISKILKGMKVVYKGRKYALSFSETLSQSGDMPDHKYTIKDAPQELANVKLYVRLDKSSNYDDSDYQITMGVYTRTK